MELIQMNSFCVERFFSAVYILQNTRESICVTLLYHLLTSKLVTSQPPTLLSNTYYLKGESTV